MTFSFTRQWVTDSLLPEVLRDHRIDDFGYIETVILDAIGNEIIWDKEDNDPSFTDKYDFDEIFDVIQNMHSGDIAEAPKKSYKHNPERSK